MKSRVPSDLRAPNHPPSLLARAFSDALEGEDHVAEGCEGILDAAFAQFCAAGIQRSTMDDVAQRAGVSRITVYRRFATKDALVAHTVRREFRRYFDQFLIDIAPGRNVEDRVVLGFVSSLRSIRGNPLIGSLLAAEANLLVRSMIGDEGRTLAAVRRFVAGQLGREQRAGNLSKGLNVELAAELMVRVCTSFVIIPSQIVDVDDDDQLSEVARKFLVPLLHAAD